jgi:hypothetical protein
MQRAIDLGLAAWGLTVDRPQPSEIGKCVWHEQKRSTLTLDGPGSQDAFTRGIALPHATPFYRFIEGSDEAAAAAVAGCKRYDLEGFPIRVVSL